MRRTLVVVVVLAAMIPLVLVAQQPTKPRLSVGTLEGASHRTGVRVWQWNPASGVFEPVWQASPLTIDQKTSQAWKNETLRSARSGVPVVADYDGDGLNDLLVIDTLGVTVYGRTPMYHPFPDGDLSGLSPALLVADVDGDGRSEVVTERAVEGRPIRRAIEIWQPTAHGLRLQSRQEFAGLSFGVLWADADNDGKNELITASDTIVILKRGTKGGWDIAAELPNIGGFIQGRGDLPAGTQVDVVRVADVDRDGRNEVVATGNSGVVTIYKHRR